MLAPTIIFRAFHGAMARPAGRVKPRVGSSRGSGQEVSISRVESGRVKRCSKSDGSERVRPGGFKFYGSGRVILTRPDPI